VIGVGIASLLDLDLKKIVDGIESRCGIKLPREVIEVYFDREQDLLFIRFREPKSIEVGEPLSTKAVVTIFTDEESGEVTAIEVIGLEDLMNELGI
jgi:uncharacterized protein YuzE